MIQSLFVGTFNTNGTVPSEDDFEKWLRSNGAADADLVMLSIQECPSCRSDDEYDEGATLSVTRHASLPSTPPPPRVIGVNGVPRRSYCRAADVGASSEPRPSSLSQDDDDAGGDAFLRAVQTALSSDHALTVDVSMGEPPTKTATKKKLGGRVEWYGFIRLLLYVKVASNTQKDKDLVTSVLRDCKIIVCPVGGKPSSFTDDPPYQPGHSPDKGAVCLSLPSLNLLVGALHLHGTNAYGVCEDAFDAVRYEQLSRISDACEAAFGRGDSPSPFRSLLAGDWNFRCEVHAAAEDKARGGRDYRAVEEIVRCGNEDDVRRLFREHDRLCSYLRRGGLGPEGRLRRFEDQDSGIGKMLALPQLLQNVSDLFWREYHVDDETPRNSFGIIPPTFPFKVGDAPPRRYWDKRTPSWTDRIVIDGKVLLRGGGVSVGGGGACSGGKVIGLGACSDVVCSDHTPVYCLINFKK